MSAERLLLAAVLMLAAPAARGEDFAGLSRDALGFAEVKRGVPVVFPRDFGVHPEFRLEWWYVTANLKDDAGASYGMQWTLFRRSAAPGPERAGFANQSLWMGHAAATAVDEHVFAETFARGGVGQAGVDATPFKAWIDDWSLESATDAPDAGLSQLRLAARGARFAYALELAAREPLVLHGDEGYSRKSEQGQASYYFSQPFYSAKGVLTLDGREIKVSGEAWLDREWSSQPLAKHQTGWDWFALHLASGEKVMLYRFRSASSGDEFAGTWIASDGTAQALPAAGIKLTPLQQTQIGERTLPTRWRVEVAGHGLQIETTPLNPAAWNATRLAYWEGPISFRGSHQGEGYLEMTGY